MAKKKATAAHSRVPRGYMLEESARHVLAEMIRPENVEEYLLNVEPMMLKDGRLVYRRKDIYSSESKGNGKPARMIDYDAAVVLYMSKLHVMKERAKEYLREVPLRTNVGTSQQGFQQLDLERKLRILTNDLKRRGGEEDEDRGKFK